jgi:hypothetical protein
VFGVGFMFSDDIEKMAREFPDVHFACVDLTPARPDGGARPSPNLVGPKFREEEGLLPAPRPRCGTERRSASSAAWMPLIHRSGRHGPARGTCAATKSGRVRGVTAAVQGSPSKELANAARAWRTSSSMPALPLGSRIGARARQAIGVDSTTTKRRVTFSPAW